MKLLNIFICSVSVLLLVVLPSCDESLPEYKEPPDVLIGKIITPDSASVFRFNIQERYPSDDRYYKVIFYGNDSIIFRFEIQNVYKKVIEDKTDIGGYVKIWDPLLPQNFATVPLNRSSLVPYRDTLQIRVGEKVWLKSAWKKLRFDDLTYAFRGKPSENYINGKIRYRPIQLKAKGYLRLYKKLGFVITPDITFSIDVISDIYDP